MRRPPHRPLAFVCSTLAIALLITASAEAQRKKPAAPAATAKKKPAATAPAKKPDAAKPAEEPSPDEKKPTKKAPTSEEDTEKSQPTEKEKDLGRASEGTKPIMADVAVGIRGFQRHLSYRDDFYGVLPSYDLGGAPEADLALGVFPIKNATGSITAGIIGSFGYAFALGSTYKAPPAGTTATTKYSTKAMQFTVGAKANFIFGTSSLGVGGEFGSQSFSVALPTAPNPNNAGIPTVDYKFIKPSVSVRIGASDKLAVLASAGYLLVLSAGQIVSPAYFPTNTASVGGVDASVGIAYAIAHHIEIRPGIDFRRYFYHFKWTPASTIATAPYPAGGALDQYYGVSIMAAFQF